MVIIYWVLFTVRAGFSPKVNKAVKAATYDLKGNDPALAEAARRKMVPLKAATSVLRFIGWAEKPLLIFMVWWFLWMICALATGTFVVLGYPI